ncbi:hypothetical protein U2088_15345, partial [Listeria monocytogenes]|uniref:hypothetical protein n=1 Tax=Listeria monocytogenes TaxID=1639 RepID=UPI002FDBB598
MIIPNHLPRRKIITALLLGDGGFGISNRKTKPLASMIYTCCSEKYKDYYEWKKQVFIEAVGREGKEYIVNNKKSSRIYCYQYFDSKMIK